MKLVTFACAMAPHCAGENRLVSDGVAEQLLASGEISASETWPPPAKPTGPDAPRRPMPKPIRPAGSPDRRSTR